MIVVEIALQGIKGFPELVRLGLRPGLNVAKPSDRALGSAIVDAVFQTLFPDPSRANATAHLVMSRAERSRIAVTFFGRDRITYRMIREADTGASKLYKYDEAKKQYRLFTDVATEAAQYVRVQQQLPDEVSYERLFIFSPDSMPSRKERARSRSGAPIVSGYDPPSGPGLPGRGHFMSGVMARPESSISPAPARGMSHTFGSSLNVTNALVQSELAQAETNPPADAEAPAVDRDEQKRELVRLRNEREIRVRADRAQNELDQLNLRKFELTEKVERITRIRTELDRLNAQGRSERDLDNLPPGFPDRLRHYKELGAKFEEDRVRLQEEISALEAAENERHVVGLSADRYFLVGAMGALVFVGLAFMIRQPLVALFNIACALVAAGAGLRYVSDLEVVARSNIKLGAARDRLERLERQHNLDTGATRRLMQKLEVDSPAELLSRVEGYERLVHQKSIADETLASMLRDPEMSGASRELESIHVRVDALEGEIMASAGSVLSVDTLEIRIERLQSELGADAPRERQRGPAVVNVPEPRSGSITPYPVPPAAEPSHIGTPIPRPVVPRVVVPRSAVPRSGSIVGTPASPPTRDIPPRIVQPRSGSIVGTPASPPTRDIPITEGTPLPSEPSKPALPSFPSSPPSAAFTPDLVPPPRSFSTMTTPLDPREFSQSNVTQPQDPLTRAPSIIPTPAPKKNRIPNADSGAKSLFDFDGGSLAADDDDEPGYGSGYGAGSGSTGSDPADGSGTSGSGYFAVGFGGLPGGVGGAAGGYGDDGGSTGPDRSRDLMQAAVDVLQVDVDQLGRTIERRLGQYLGAFTDGRYTGAQFGPRGEVSLVLRDDDDGIVAYPSLDDETLDLVDSAIRFCLVETIVQRHRIPMIFNDPFTSFPPKKRKLLTQMLAYVGGATQVIVLSSKSDIEGHQLKW